MQFRILAHKRGCRVAVHAHLTVAALHKPGWDGGSGTSASLDCMEQEDNLECYSLCMAVVLGAWGLQILALADSLGSLADIHLASVAARVDGSLYAFGCLLCDISCSKGSKGPHSR